MTRVPRVDDGRPWESTSHNGHRLASAAPGRRSARPSRNVLPRREARLYRPTSSSSSGRNASRRWSTGVRSSGDLLTLNERVDGAVHCTVGVGRHRDARIWIPSVSLTVPARPFADTPCASRRRQPPHPRSRRTASV